MIDADALQSRLLNAFGETVTYTPRDGAASTIKAVRTVHFVDNPLDHTGIGSQTITFDIATTLPRPGQNYCITDANGVDWYVKQVPHVAFEGQWRVTVERQSR